eukprot:GDKI01045516.1.p1 GENE.GDKI01045516.1~~GDKI01045516.1.p1  ORF type:complete len:246 (-),score=43.79 GDKI01045516.1:235-930(-)
MRSIVLCTLFLAVLQLNGDTNSFAEAQIVTPVQSVILSHIEYHENKKTGVKSIGIPKNQKDVCVDLGGSYQGVMQYKCSAEGDRTLPCRNRRWSVHLSVSPGGQVQEIDEDSPFQTRKVNNKHDVLHTLADTIDRHDLHHDGADVRHLLASRHEEVRDPIDFPHTISVFSPQGAGAGIVACSFPPGKETCSVEIERQDTVQRHVWMLRATNEYDCKQWRANRGEEPEEIVA